jgi:CheY-like chemotaxis protein
MAESVAKLARTATHEKKILVAEDNLINQKVVVRLLDMLGYTADVVGNGVEALRLLGSDHYDAVLMDMHMPVMDGLETTRAIRRLDGAASRIPIIAVTANAIQGERQKCLSAGMNDYITKPIEKEAFASALEYWTSQAKSDALLGA